MLTHWGRVTQKCIGNQTIIGSDNGLSPGRRQDIIWSNAGILLIWTLGTSFSEILSKIHTFSLKKIHFKMSSAKWRQVQSMWKLWKAGWLDGYHFLLKCSVLKDIRWKYMPATFCLMAKPLPVPMLAYQFGPVAFISDDFTRSTLASNH